jgi:hypothetical protein
MFVIVGEEALRTVAVVVNFEASFFEAVNQACGAEGGRGFLAARLKSGGAGRRTDQGNFLRLTDDFDRQS